MNYYLELDYKTGNLYQYSQEAQEGFVSHTTSTGKTSYRKYFREGVTGTLTSAYLSTGDAYGMQLRLQLQTAADTYTLKFPVYAQGGRIDSFVESLAAYLPAMQLNKAYRVFPYTMKQTRNNKEITKRGVSVKDCSINAEGFYVVGDKTDLALTYLKKGEVYDPKNPSQIPPLVFEEGLDGKSKPTALSQATRKDFYEKVIQKAIQRLDASPSNEGEASVPVKAYTPATSAESVGTSQSPIGQKPAPAASVADDVPKARGAAPIPTATPAVPANIVVDDSDDDEELPF